MNNYKEQIYAATSVADVNAIDLVYEKATEATTEETTGNNAE